MNIKNVNLNILRSYSTCAGTFVARLFYHVLHNNYVLFQSHHFSNVTSYTLNPGKRWFKIIIRLDKAVQIYHIKHNLFSSFNIQSLCLYVYVQLFMVFNGCRYRLKYTTQYIFGIGIKCLFRMQKLLNSNNCPLFKIVHILIQMI